MANSFFGELPAITALFLSIPLICSALTPTTLTLTSAPSPTSHVSGQAVTYTAVVSAASGTPTGMIYFIVDGRTSTSTILDSSLSASIAPGFQAGNHTIRALYTGDSTFAASGTDLLTQTVSKAASTVQMASNPPQIAQPVAIRAAVTINSPGSGTPGGTVDFAIGTAPISGCTGVAVTNGVAICNTSFPQIGTYLIGTIYSGDANTTASGGSMQLMVGKCSPGVYVAALPLQAASGAPVTVNVQVLGATGVPNPTGSVIVLDGDTPLATTSIDSVGKGGIITGSGSIAALTAGTHDLSALYIGDSNYLSGRATAVTVTIVGKLTPTVTVTATSASLGQPVKITAMVLAGVTSLPTGTVDFTNGTTPIAGCTGVSLMSGSALCNTTFTQAGALTLNANYSGDSTHVANQGSAAVTVAKGNSVTSVSSAPGAPLAGGTVTLTATVLGLAGGPAPTGGVTFVDGAATLGTASVGSDGRAILTAPSGAVAALAAGTHTVSVTYGGDSNYLTSAAGPIAVVVSKPATTMTLTATTAQIAQPVKITAQLTNSAAAGTVDFSSGGSAIAGCTGIMLLGGSAVCNTSFAALGTVTVGASYSGDANNPAATGSVQVAVGKCSPSAYVAASSASPSYGSAETFGALVLGATGVANPTGTVTISDGATVLGTLTLGADGRASLVSPSAGLAPLAAGAHNITMSYSGDANYLTANATPLPITVAKVTPAIAVTALPASPKPGQSVSLTAAVSPAGAGTVGFSTGTAIAGCTAVAIVTGSATCVTTFAQAGSLTITASYAGDTNTNAATGTLALTVAQSKPSALLSVSSTPSSPVYGAAVTLSAGLTAVAGGPAPTGSIVFADGTVTLATVAVNTAGQASVAAPGGMAFPAAGPHSLVATYSGDNYYASAIAAPIALTIGKASTTTTLTTPAGGAFTATVAVVAPGSGTPTGQVQFSNGGTVLGIAPLQAQGSSLAATWPRGTLTGTISAAYLGDPNFSGSTSAPGNETTAKALVTVASNRNPATLGDSITFTVYVTNSSGPGTPSGTVQLLSDGASIGSATLAGGVASVTTSTLAVGTHAMVANYSGDTNYPAVSGTLSQVVNKVSATLLLTSSVPAAVFGQQITFNAALSTSSGGQVRFLDGATSLGLMNMTAGVATLKLSNLTPGAHSLTASWADNSGGTATASPLLQMVGRAQTTTTLSSKVSAGTSTMTAVVAVVGPGAGVPTGNIQFVNAATNAVLTTVPLNGLTATAPLPSATDPLVAIYAGDGNFQDSTSVPLVQVAATNSASYSVLNLAADEIVTLFGSNFAPAAAFASPPADSLGGTTIKITDSAGVSKTAQIFYVSPVQASILVPAGLAAGAATLTVTAPGQSSVPVKVTIGQVAPGIFTSNASGQGVAAAQVVLAHSDGTQDAPKNVGVFDATQNLWVASAIDMGSAGDSAFLLLYGTGIRHFAKMPTCTIGGRAVPVQYAGAQGSFAGLDQINILLPSNLRGAGTVTVVLTVDGVQANAVTIAFQ